MAARCWGSGPVSTPRSGSRAGTWPSPPTSATCSRKSWHGILAQRICPRSSPDSLRTQSDSPARSARSGRGLLERREQGLQLPRVVVSHAVDKKGRRPVDAAGDAAAEVFPHPGLVHAAAELFAKPCDIETQVASVLDQILAVEGELPLEEAVVHLPELALRTSRFGGLRGVLRVRMAFAPRDVAPADDPLAVDDEQRSLAEPVAVAVRSVAARHRPLRLEVREQGKVQLALVGERPVAPGAIHRDAEELGAVARELGEDLVVQRHLIAADGTPVRGIKRQDDRLAAVVAQRDGLIRRAVEREVGCLSPGRKRTRSQRSCVGHVMFLSHAFRVSDSSGTIGNSSRSALRSTAIVVRAPIRSVTSKRCRSSIPDTVCPSKPMMMSPDVTPARAAGLSGSTPVTSTPLFASIPSARCASRSSGTFCPATPMRPRRILPCRISWPVTTFAVLMPTAKQIPWAGRITAVLTPTTRPRASTSGPPELPGFKAASVWITSSISRPPTQRHA